MAKVARMILTDSRYDKKGFLGGQLKRVTLYVLKAAFCDLAMFFLLQFIFFGIYFPSETFTSIVSHCPDTFPLQKKLQSG